MNIPECTLYLEQGQATDHVCETTAAQQQNERAAQTCAYLPQVNGLNQRLE